VYPALALNKPSSSSSSDSRRSIQSRRRRRRRRRKVYSKLTPWTERRKRRGT